MAALLAEVAYPVHSETGIPEIETSKIGAIILGAGKVPGSKRKDLEKLLPSEADLWYRNGTVRIELDVPPDRRDRTSLHKLAKKVRSAILKGFGVRAGLCPVTSSKEVLNLVRRTSNY